MPKQYKSSGSAPQISFDELLFSEEAVAVRAPTELIRAPVEPLKAPETSAKPPRNPTPQATERPLSAPEVAPPWTGEAQLKEATETATKTDQARQRVEEGLAALAAELEAGHSGALLKWLDTMSRFHSYSLNNTLLIAWQRPEATHVAGFHTWKDMGRTVKKGEKGIMILAPIPKRVKADNPDQGGEERADEGAAQAARQGHPIRGEVWGFRVAYVFDIDQTEGKELPEFAKVQGDPAEHLDRLKALVKAEGIALEYVKGLQGAHGVSLKGTIKLVEGLTPAHEFSVLAHELAHELLHKDPKRRAETTKTVRETEAEAVAFVVCRAIGLDTSQQHSDYIKLYRGDVKTLTDSLDAIRDTSARILGTIEEKKTPERRGSLESQERPQKSRKRPKAR